MDKCLPNRVVFNTDIDEPSRMYERKDRDDPVCTKSNIDIEDPKRNDDNTDRAEPIFKNFLKDIEDPKIT